MWLRSSGVALCREAVAISVGQLGVCRVVLACKADGKGFVLITAEHVAFSSGLVSAGAVELTGLMCEGFRFRVCCAAAGGVAAGCC